MSRPQGQLAILPESGLILALIPMVAAAPASARPEGWLATAVDGVSAQRAVVTVRAGREAGVRLGDRVVVLRDDEAAAAGQVIFLAPKRAGVRLTWTGQTVAAGDAAIVILPRILRGQRTRLPRGVTVRGRLSGLNRGGTTAWVGVGRAAGLETGDRWLIRRGRIPIAYGQAVLLDDDTTLLELTSIVRDLRPEDGDRAALAPSPFERATQRRSATVLSARSEGEEQVLILGAGQPRRFRTDDRLDLFRDGAYVGHATVARSTSLLVEARTTGAFMRVAAEVGDGAIRRAGVGLTGRVSVLDADVALITTGELDGVRVGDEWWLVRDPQVRMEVQVVRERHCQARIVQLRLGSTALPALWDEVRLGPPGQGVPQIIGRMPKRMAVDWLATVALAPDASAVAPGTVLRIDAKPAAGGLVLHTSRDTLVVYMPECWGGGVLAGAPVSLPASPNGTRRR